MANDPLEPVRKAEAEIQKRAKTRESMAIEHRGMIAAELIADEMTRGAAELTVMRGLLAMISAKL
jgi:hypothetical protein